MRVGNDEAGPYSRAEVEEMISSGLHDALVKPSEGKWVHLAQSEFASQLPKPKTNVGWKIAAVLLGVVAILAIFQSCQLRVLLR